AGFQLATAQSLFDKKGKLDDIRVAARQGISPTRLVSQIRPILPQGTQVRTGAEQAKKSADSTNSFLSFFKTFLLAFAGIALFVGSFVIANSLSITIAQRTREFATLRTLGANRRQILRAVLIGMGLGALMIFIGVALLSARWVPSLAQVLGWPAVRIGGAVGRIARENARRNPQRTASTASALMIGLALVTLVAILAAGIISNFRGAVNALFKGDYVVTAQ